MGLAAEALELGRRDMDGAEEPSVPRRIAGIVEGQTPKIRGNGVSAGRARARALAIQDDSSSIADACGS